MSRWTGKGAPVVDEVEGPVSADARVVEAARRQAEAAAERERASARAQAVRRMAADATADPVAAKRAALARPEAELAELETDVAAADAGTAYAVVVAQARADRLPTARARIAAPLRALYAALDEAAQTTALLRDTIAEENARMGTQVFDPAMLLWPEFVSPRGNGAADSLLAFRRSLLVAQGWLDGGG